MAYLLPLFRGTVAGNPIRSPIELALFLHQQCGAEGYRIVDGLILALRWDTDGNEVIVDRFEYTAVH